MPISYVVEVEILPKYKNHPEDFASLYADEMGKVFFRRNAANARPMVGEIVQSIKSEVDECFRPIQREFKAINAALMGDNASFVLSELEDMTIGE